MQTCSAWSTPDSPAFLQGEQVHDYVIAANPPRAGGMGQVFLAVHEPSGHHVAIKALAERNEVSLSHFQREVSTLTALDYPGIVKILDHGICGGRPWYAMDWLDGPTLRHVLAAKPAESAEISLQATERAAPPNDLLREVTPQPPARPPTSIDEWLSLCVQILHALDYLHSRGVVHGDLKPENIFVLSDSRTVLADFGISHWFAPDREHLNVLPRSVGSLGYMPPEQIRGALIDARADLYAVGCLLYEGLTGLNPFWRTTANGTLLAQLNAVPAPPSMHRPGLINALDSLILRLLSKSVADRPRYAREVLSELEAQGHAFAAPRRDIVSVPGPLYRSPLLGRALHLQSLRNSIEQVGAGTTVRVLVQGEIGIGKTRLVLEALDLATRATLRVFCVRCDGNDGSPLRDLIRSISGGIEPEALLAFPATASEQRQWLTDHTLRLLRDLHGSPALIAIDDLDLADELTKRLVQQLATQAATERVALLLLCTESIGRSANLTSFEAVTLERLTRDEVELAVCAMLATEYASSVLVDFVYDRSSGVPLMLGQILRALLDNGHLVHAPQSGWHLTASFKPEQFHDETNGDSEFWRTRLRGLPSSELPVAHAAAALGPAFDLPLLAAVYGEDPSSVATAVERLVALDILKATSTTYYRFTHPSLREALYRANSQQACLRIHDTAAHFLGSSGLSCAERETEIAWHHSRSGQPKAAANHYEAAANHHLAAQSFQPAADALTLAKRQLELVYPTPSTKIAHLCEAIADAAMPLRRLDTAIAELNHALRLVAENLNATARLKRKLAAAHQQDHARAGELLRSAIELLDSVTDNAEQRSEWLQSHLDLMFIYYWQRNPVRVLELGQRIEQSLMQCGTEEQKASYSFNVAAGLMALHRYVTGDKELELVNRALTFYERTGNRMRAAMTSFLRSMILLFSDDLEGAALGFESLLAIGKKTSSVTVQVRAMAYLCVVERKRRDKNKLRRLASATLGLSKEHEMLEYQGFALANLAWLAYQDGNAAKCEQLARSALDCWSSASTKTAFTWMATLPLLAVLSERRSARPSELRSLAATLLDESQQRLPDELDRSLDGVTRSDDATLFTKLSHVMNAATNAHVL